MQQKHYYYILFFLLLLFSYEMNIYAEKCSCTYEADFSSGLSTGTSGEGVYKAIMNFNNQTNKITVEYEEDFGYNPTYMVLDPYIDENYNEEKLIEYFNGRCPDRVYSCRVNIPQLENYFTGEAVAFIINRDLYSKLSSVGGYEEGKEFYFDRYSNRYIYRDKNDSNHNFDLINPEVNCIIAYIIEDESNCSTFETNFGCETYKKLHDKLEANDCMKNSKCKTKDRVEYNKQVEKIISYCNTKISHSSYDGDPCVKACLSFKTNNQELVKSVCGFSERLILFVGNIIKWCKYIVPVIAIVLGILDFIKAIGNGKEDEMKKAQGKFIKRLIVAGLVFIMPFIIEFVLNKMGFDVNGCGIIDL